MTNILPSFIEISP